MAKAPKSNPKPTAKPSKASAKPLPKKGSPPAKAKGDSVDVKAMEEAAGLTKPAKRVKPLTEVYSEETAAKPAVPARLVALSVLRPSPTNPRKNLGDLTELAASLASIGQLQPLVVRPHPQEEGALEVVCGHRRFAAAGLAKLDELLVVERNLSDREVLEAQLTENGQRSDVHPLEEARALHQLHRHHRVEATELAARLGRSESYVHQRLRLMHLTSEAATAFEAGRLTLGVAVRLARLPEKSQHDALPQVVVPEGAIPRQVGDVRWVLDRLHLKLVDSPFKLDDDTLPGGACTRCPKRSGNQVALFTEAEGPDLCLDRDCHQAKVQAFGKRRIEEAQDAGKKVLTAEESSRVLNMGGRAAWIAPYVNADDRVDLAPEEEGTSSMVKLKELLGDKAEVVFAVHEGKLVELFRKEDVHKALKARGAPEEVVEEYAPQVDSDDEDDSGETWEERRKREEREAAEQKKRATLLIDKCPVCDPEVFRLAVVGEILDNEWTYREALEKLFGGEEKEGELDLEAALLALPVEAIWKLWLGAVLQASGAPLDLIEKHVGGEAPAPATPPADPAATPAAAPEEPADDEDVLAAFTVGASCIDPRRGVVAALTNICVDDEGTAGELVYALELDEIKAAAVDRLAERAQGAGLVEMARMGEDGTRWWRPTTRGRLLTKLDQADKPLGATALAKACGVDLLDLSPLLNAAVEAGEVSKQKTGYRIVADPRLVAQQQAARAKAKAKKAKAGAS
jgi:ParB/RepB/Spo0J family partition protein